MEDRDQGVQDSVEDLRGCGWAKGEDKNGNALGRRQREDIASSLDECSYSLQRFWGYGQLGLLKDSDNLPHTIWQTEERGLCNWLKNTMLMSNSAIQEHCGKDAKCYLSFQRNIICLLTIFTILSVGIIMPVNLTRNLPSNDTIIFGYITIGNIQYRGVHLWIPIVFALIYIIITVAFLRNHTLGIECNEEAIGKLNTSIWTVTDSTDPEDIYYENLSKHGVYWWVRCLVINVCLFIFLFFLTTPSMLLVVADKLKITEAVYNLHNSTVSMLFPTFLLWCMSSLLPTIVYYSTRYEAHWRKSAENWVMMHKVYIYEIFMILILPSLGIPNLDFFFHWLFDKTLEVQGPARLECIFLTDQGAFFVKYIITEALIGNAMQLIRLPGLIVYTFRMLLAKSAEDKRKKQKRHAYEFPYGAMYARMLTIFSIIMAYSLTCPIITPFGLIFMLLKYVVDRHNLYYAYLPTKLDTSIHLAAVKKAHTAPILCLMWLFLYSLSREGIKVPSTVFSLILLLITIVLWTLCACFGYFKLFSLSSCNTEPTNGKSQEPVKKAETSERGLQRTPHGILNIKTAQHVIIDMPTTDTEDSCEP
ncbi:CSC1-like protein 1 [Rhinophrynus dorsalis]